MDFKKMLEICLINIFLISFIGCEEKRQTLERIEFKTDYKFSSEIQKKVKADTTPWKHQISATEYAMKGDYKNALIQWDSVTGIRNKKLTAFQIDSINQKYTKHNAADYIIRKAKKSKVVIINEAHHNSLHRVFTKSLLKELYEIGYKNLGLEALNNGTMKDSLLNERKYPVQSTGHYIRDPQFGNLVRTALKANYNVFAYEQTTYTNGREREIEQAKNIAEVIRKHPDEKFLIFCGYDHVIEGEYKHWGKAMAARLTEYTGIDPLTVNQVAYSEKSNPEYNSPFLKALNIREASVISDTAGNPYKYVRGKGWSDIVVFHPNTNYVDNRPDWLFKNGNQNVAISVSGFEIDFPLMVMAYKKGEDINNSVPYDITEISLKDSLSTPHLGLEKGDYEIIITDGTRSYKFEKSVH